MLKSWYYERDGQKFGPFTADEMRAKAASGELKPTDQVWREGMSAAVAARLVPTLFPPFENPLANP